MAPELVMPQLLTATDVEEVGMGWAVWPRAMRKSSNGG
jgi:hypothetical protein